MTRKLGRLIPALLMLLAVVPTSAHAGWTWKRLRFATTLTSSTSPTFASQFGSAANTGIEFADSSTYAINAVGTGTITGTNADTSQAFTLEDWVPSASWIHSDTTSAQVNTKYGGAGFPTDSTLAFYLVVGPATNNEGNAAVTASADSIYAVVDGSMDGKTWTTIMPGNQGAGMAEIGTTDSWGAAFYTSARNRLATSTNVLIGWPLYRVRIAGDVSAANTGRFTAKVGYFRRTSQQR